MTTSASVIWPPTSSLHAPDHLIALVAAIAPPPPPGPTGEPTAEQWHRQLRRVADTIWSTAWTAGAVEAASVIQPAPIEITVPPGSKWTR